MRRSGWTGVMAEPADGPLTNLGTGAPALSGTDLATAVSTHLATDAAAESTSTVATHSLSPTLEDVARLTPESDYSAYTAPSVDAQVRNQALRKLFLSDPHFQQSDGLDVAIDEVVHVAQSPLARQRKIMQARAMGLLDDDLLDQPEPEADPPVG